MATFPGAAGAPGGIDPNLLAALMGGAGAGAPTAAPSFTPPPVPQGFAPAPQFFTPPSGPQGYGPVGFPQFGCGGKLNKLA